MAQRALTPGNAAYCSECGAETSPDAASCARCGEPFEGSMQAVLCPICNSINPASAVECLNCNAKFPEAGLDEVPTPAGPESPEEEYLRRILQLSREKARRRGANGTDPGTEPASFLESDRVEGEVEESLWKLAEPFDRMLERRKRRLEQMEALIERAQGRIKALESSADPAEVQEREELKTQIETLLLEKEDILKLEEGLVDMETTYRNILRMQKEELKARETSLRGRIAAFRHELESREKAFGQLKERESDFVRREDEFRTVMNRVHEREREIEKREELMRDKARLLDERHHALSEAEVDLERHRWELEQKISARPPSKEEPTPVTIKSDQELGALQARMVQLEEQMEQLAEERNQLMEQQKELLNLKGDLKVVMKDIDELLGDLPKDKIRKFAKSEKFALYEKLLEQLQLL
jgi:DNA repair exonuclease SbcCD ATPase subunit/ribosomal protein L40E